MKIAGVETGNRRGEVQELSAAGKAEYALKMGLALQDEFKGKSVTVEELTVDLPQEHDAGAKLRGMWANRQYTFTGKARFWARDLETDSVACPPDEHRAFELSFHDVLDANGMPDVAVDSLVVS